MCVIQESPRRAISAESLLDLVFLQVRGTIARLDQGANLLYAGCGRGEALAELARRFPRSRFLGLESSFAALTAARDHLVPNLWVEAEPRQLPRLGGSFDFALRPPGLNGVKLADLAHLLRPDGLLFDLRHPEQIPPDYPAENLTIIRDVILPEYYCTIVRK